jgi:hypothetical protein
MKGSFKVTFAEVIFAFGYGSFPIEEIADELGCAFAILNGDSQAEITRMIDWAVGLSTNDSQSFAIGAFQGLKTMTTP